MSFPNDRDVSRSPAQSSYVTTVDTTSSSSTTTTMPTTSSTNPYFASRNPTRPLPTASTNAITNLCLSVGGLHVDNLYSTLKANRDRSELGNEAAACLAEYNKRNYFHTSDKRALLELSQHACAIKDKQLLELCTNKALVAKVEPGDYEIFVEFADLAQSMEGDDNLKIFMSLSLKYRPKDTEEAKQALQRVLQRNPKCSYAYTSLGMILLQEDSFLEAEEALQHAIMINPKPVKDYIVLASILMYQGQLDRALDAVHASISLDPMIDLAYEVQGTIFYHQKRMNDAKAALLQAIDLNPENAEAHILYNKICRSEKNPQKHLQIDEIEQELRKAIQDNPNDPHSYETLGDMMKARGEYDEARTLFAEAIQRGSTNPRLYIAFAEMLCTQNLFDLAKTTLQQTIKGYTKMGLENSDEYVEKATTLLSQALKATHVASEMNEIEQGLREAIEENPTDPFAYETLSDVLKAERRLEEAKDVLLEAIIYNPTNLDIHAKYEEIAQNQDARMKDFL